jgi:hypothetical protein
MDIPYERFLESLLFQASLQRSCPIQITIVQTNRSEGRSIYSIANLYI